MSNENITLYVANKIKKIRENKNITQQELAEALKTTQQTIARYENGERKPDHNVLFALAEYFKVSIDYFFPPLTYNSDEQLKKILKQKGLTDESGNIKEDYIDRLLELDSLIANYEKKKIN